MSERRRRLEEQAAQARRDLDELAAQVDDGEIDEKVALQLRSSYQRELEAATAELAGMGLDEDEDAPVARSRTRMLIGGAILAAGLVIALGVVGGFAQDRDDSPLEGIASGAGADLDSVSNETMEAVIESYREDPSVADQIPLMEFRLAERYFEDQEYLESFPHYRNVIENPRTPTDRVQASLTRVGWMVWVLNGETDLALTTLDQALSIDPANSETLYVKGQVLWCGAGRPAEAAALFEQVLADDRLEPEVADQVRTDLQMSTNGEDCGL